MVTARPHRRLPRLLGAAAGVLMATGAWFQVAEAAMHDVEVATTADGEAFSPNVVEITAGGSVTWQWTANEPHTVTFEGGTHERGRCRPLVDAADCTAWTHTVEFPDTGEFGYQDEYTGATGRVVVTAPEPPARPTPTQSDPSPTPPSPEPDPSPTTTPPPDPSPTPAPEPSPTPSPTPESTTRTVAPRPVEAVSSPDATPSADEPSVAPVEDTPSSIPEPTFEDFPEPDDPESDVAGDVAIDAPDEGGGTARTAWRVLGGVTVLGTFGAFGRVVLFSDPWET